MIVISISGRAVCVEGLFEQERTYPRFAYVEI